MQYSSPAMLSSRYSGPYFPGLEHYSESDSEFRTRTEWSRLHYCRQSFTASSRKFRCSLLHIRLDEKHFQLAGTLLDLLLSLESIVH